MKKYLAPEIEKVEYEVEDVICVSGQGVGKEGGDIDDLLGDL